jgi:hypothetical protein
MSRNLEPFAIKCLGNWKLKINFSGGATQIHHMEVTKYMLPAPQYHGTTVGLWAIGWPEDKPDIKWRMDTFSIGPNDTPLPNRIYVIPIDNPHAFFHILAKDYNPAILKLSGSVWGDSWDWEGNVTFEMYHL